MDALTCLLMDTAKELEKQPNPVTKALQPDLQTGDSAKGIGKPKSLRESY